MLQFKKVKHMREKKLPPGFGLIGILMFNTVQRSDALMAL